VATKKQDSIKLDMKSKVGVREALEFQMRIFDSNYNFEQDELYGGESALSNA
jgi:hypothetical protein